MSAIEFLTKAIEFDVAGRRSEALKLYRSGIDELLKTCNLETDETRKQHYRSKINEYMVRAEQLKRLLPVEHGKVVDKIFIMEGDTGKSYDQVFGKYLKADVTEVQLDEPYLREHHQLTNLVRFCELLVAKCRNLKVISVTTTVKDDEQKAVQAAAFKVLATSLDQARRIKLEIRYSDNLHDRQIILNNGYVIKIGRGLNYFQPPPSKYSLGNFDLDQRKCKQCNVDVLFCEENKQS